MSIPASAMSLSFGRFSSANTPSNFASNLLPTPTGEMEYLCSILPRPPKKRASALSLSEAEDANAFVDAVAAPPAPARVEEWPVAVEAWPVAPARVEPLPVAPARLAIEALLVVPVYLAPDDRLAERPDFLSDDWIVIERTRRMGTTAGRTDKYYIQRSTGRKLRSLEQVRCYLKTGSVKKPRKTAEKGDSDVAEAKSTTPAKKSTKKNSSKKQEVKIQAEASRNEHGATQLGYIMAELEEAKLNLEQVQEENLKIVNCLVSLREELEQTKLEIKQLKAKESEKKVVKI